MGCGASASDKNALKPIPLQNSGNITPETVSIPKQQTKNQPQKTIAIDDKKSTLPTQKDKKDLKSSAIKNTSKPKTESKSNLQNSTTDLKGSTTQKRTDSVGKNNQPKTKTNDLRSSSIGKSQSGTKINSQSNISKKNANPQDPTKMKMTESVIQQESGLKNTQHKDKDKTIKKIKSVKNNKELTDLIKIYGL